MSRAAAAQIVEEGSTLARLGSRVSINSKDLVAAQPLILLIHGFTAHGMRLEALGTQISEWCTQEESLPSALTVVYSYNSFNGIEAAANTLSARLLSYCPRSAGVPDVSALQDKIIIIAHSMGGLVARHFAAKHPSFVRGLVMLGTPNDGVSTDSMLDFLLTVIENLDDSSFPILRVKSSMSRKQLTKKDDLPGRTLIDRMSSEWTGLSRRPRTLTISGGKPLIRFSKNSALDSHINKRIQRLMAGATNDGLVPELSVDMNISVLSRRVPEYVHVNDYPEYPTTNHTHLVDNEHLRRLIYNWILDGDRRSAHAR